jgi:Tfp pilus assembly protein PilV
MITVLVLTVTVLGLSAFMSRVSFENGWFQFSGL